MTGVDIFSKEAIAISAHYPTLSCQEENGQPVVMGTIRLEKEELFIDEYYVRIIGHKQYPKQFPLVFETGGRLPFNIDWHVFPDGHCCLKSIPEEILICREGINLSTFISNQVIPYFFNQKHRELHGFYLHERKHGDPGNIQFFEEVFETNQLQIIALGLLALYNDQLPNRVSKCFCGSEIKYRHCHKKVLKKLSIYSKEELAFFLTIIKKQFK